MNKLKYWGIAIFLAAAALFGAFTLRQKVGENRSQPVITIEGETIEVSVNDDESALLQGVTAVDAEGRDITESVLVESIGPFNDDDLRVVTYAAVDSNNNVTHAQRSLKYKDYTEPRFSFAVPLSFRTDTTALTKMITVSDCLDGDITGNLRLISDEQVNVMVPGNYSAELTVTNSTGRLYTLPVTIEIFDDATSRSKPVIGLSEYITYIPRGTKFDPTSYLSSVTISGTTYELTNEEGSYGTESVDNVQKSMNYGYVNIDSNVKTDETGNYSVRYSFTDPEHGTGTVTLYVVVTEGGTEVK